MAPLPPNQPTPSLEFYYSDGNIVFQVCTRIFATLSSKSSVAEPYCLQFSNTLYRLHKSILASRLDLFGGMFMVSSGHHNPEDGQDDQHPVLVQDGVAIREDFEALIKHIYGQ